MDETGFQIAVAITGTSNGIVKHDRKYFEWKMIGWGVQDDGSWFKEFEGDLKHCTEADYSKLYTLQSNN